MTQDDEIVEKLTSPESVAWETADEFLHRAIELLDARTIYGGAHLRPELAAAVMAAASSDYAVLLLDRGIDRLCGKIDGLAAEVRRIAEALEKRTGTEPARQEPP